VVGQSPLFDTGPEPPPEVLIARAAPGLPPVQAGLLAEALQTKDPIRIVYQSAEGHRSERVIEPLDIEDGHLLRAYCRLRSDERVFALSRIRSVALI
jgi:predicted DNA-binding transcriptional regulator YafY